MRPPRAFSLIEVIVAMAILSVGLIGSLRVFPMGLRASQQAEMRSRASLVAQRTIEAMKLTAFDQLVDGDTSTTEEAFEVTTSIKTPTGEGLVDPTRLKQIDVIVEWTQQGRSRQLEFVTYLVRHET